MSTTLGGSTDGGNPGAGTTGGGGAPGNAGAGGAGAGAHPPGAGSDAGAPGGTPGAGTGGSWRDSLPEDIRANPAISSFQDIGALAKSFIHAQSMVGKKGAIVPGEKATDEEWQAFYTEIGVPAADKYTVEAPKDYKVPDPVMAQFKDIAAKNGLLPKQAAAVLDWYSKFETQSVSTQKEALANYRKTQIEGLKKEWGEGYQRSIEEAKFAVKELGGDELLGYLNKSGLGDDTYLIKTFAKAAKLFGEDRLREGGVTEGGMTPSEIQGQLDELRANGDKNGLYDKSHPMHSVTLGKLEALAKRLTGGR